MMRRGLILALTLVWLLPPMAQAACRQALAIGLDVSGSVDTREYRLQLDGLAAALLHPEVRQALLSMPQAPVTLSVYEWSGAADQRVILPWSVLNSDAAIAGAAQILRQSQRNVSSRTTAIGAAMLTGAALLAEQSACWKRTLDLSGDGLSNDGPRPRDVKSIPQVRDMAVNALIVGTGNADIGDRRQMEAAELLAYFRAEVIQGPDAFVEVALGFDEFEAAMVRKLLKELEGLNLTRVFPDQ